MENQHLAAWKPCLRGNAGAVAPTQGQFGWTALRGGFYFRALYRENEINKRELQRRGKWENAGECAVGIQSRYARHESQHVLQLMRLRAN